MRLTTVNDLPANRTFAMYYCTDEAVALAMYRAHWHREPETILSDGRYCYAMHPVGLHPADDVKVQDTKR